MNKISRRSLARYAADQLEKGTSTSKLAGQLASIVIESGQTKQVNFLVNDIIWELEQRGQLTTASLTTARPLSRELESAIKTAVKKAAKVDTVITEERIDKNVLGGIRIETPDRVWDSTISRKLKDLREAF
jgi:F0F1-type ATP synthase delta subunit